MVGINFRNKSEVYSYHLAVHHHDLKMDEKKSVGKPSMEGNLIVHGDNLLALKSLIPKYEGRVNCIYIDPPYNTGSNNGWVYNDNVNSKLMKDWLGSTVDINDQNRHDKWCCMMWPRLQLLKQLLAEDGVIFISIDDNEAHHLRMMMDEIFGEENFVNYIVWVNNLKGRQISNHGAVKTNEYILLYSKNKEQIKEFVDCVENLKESMPCIYKGFDYTPMKDDRGQYVIKNELNNTNIKFNNETRKNLFFDIFYNPQTKEVRTDEVNEEGFIKIGNKKIPNTNKYYAWRWSREKIISESYNLHFKIINKNEVKVFTKIRNFKFTNFKDIILGLSTNLEGSEEVKDIVNQFDNPKPVQLVHQILRISATKGNEIILDSFAGSGTTAHATLKLNKEDGGNRKFILVECQDYADSITAERVRRVIKGVPSAKDQSLKNGLGGEFTYVQLGEAIDFNKIILGEALPSYKALASLLFLQIIGKSLPEIKTDKETWYVGENEKYRVHLIYDSNKKFLQGKESCLKLDLLKKIASKLKKEQQAVIFAAGRYVDFEHLIENNALFFYIPHQINKHIGG